MPVSQAGSVRSSARLASRPFRRAWQRCCGGAARPARALALLANQPVPVTRPHAANAWHVRAAAGVCGAPQGLWRLALRADAARHARLAQGAVRRHHQLRLGRRGHGPAARHAGQRRHGGAGARGACSGDGVVVAQARRGQATAAALTTVLRGREAGPAQPAGARRRALLVLRLGGCGGRGLAWRASGSVGALRRHGVWGRARVLLVAGGHPRRQRHHGAAPDGAYASRAALSA